MSTSAMAKIGTLLANMYDQVGPDHMPNVLKCSYRTRDTLFTDVDRFTGGLVSWPITRIVTDYGELRVEIDPQMPPHEVLLVREVDESDA